jgi:outer membrane protein assembly factor BamB
MKRSIVLVALMALVPLGAAADEADMVRAAGTPGGLVVHLGCGDGAMTARMRLGEGFLVQGLDTDSVAVQKARTRLREKGVYGPVTVASFDGQHLPYTDNLVNVLVVSQPYQVSTAEMKRALAPGGVAYIKKGEDWDTLRQPWPEGIDEWTHYLHGPGNNAVAEDTQVGPPRHVQWLAAPRWSRNHHKLASISSAVTARGLLFAIVDEATAANMAVPSKWRLVARDAFSGVTLWKKPIKSWTWHRHRFRSGPPQMPRLLLTSGDRVYAPLGLGEPVSVMDARTGKTLKTFPATAQAEEIILSDGTLLAITGSPVAEHAVGNPAFRGKLKLPNRKSVVAVDAQSGSKRWQWSAAEGKLMPETLAADGQRAFVQVGESVVCLGLASGKERWTFGDRGKGKRGKRIGFGRSVLVVSDGVVLCKLGGDLVAMAAESGQKLWQCKAGGGFHAPVDVFVIDGKVWLGDHPSDSVAPPPVKDFNACRDLRTGEVKERNHIMLGLQSAGHHHRCYREKATARYIMTGKRGIEFMDLQDSNHSRNNWVRGTCQYGILPANGLVYAPPHACGCYMESKLWGFYALAAEREAVSDPERRIADNQRLQRGPAYDKISADAPADAADWPQYRHDALRSGVAGTAVPAELAQAWATDIGGELTQPVVARGKVVLASVNDGTVHALDASSGRRLWSHVAGGRVDSPPAIHGNRVLFGSADGWVTCLRLGDGAVAWRFLAASTDVRTVDLDQVESLWPVHGSVLILDGVAYCSAGRSTWLDGGIDLYGLNPATGAILHKSHFESSHPEFGKGKEKAKKEHKTRVAQNTTDYKTFLQSDRSDSFSMAGGALSDVLVSDGRNVFLHHVKFSPNLEKQDELTRHLFSTSSLLDGAENHRSHWVLGTGDFSRVGVAYSWIVNRPGRRQPTIAVPTGVTMVFTDRAVWGVRRKGDANGRYYMFQKDNEPFAAEEKPLPDFRRIPRKQATACVWKKDLPVRTRALVKAGDHLFLGAMPVAVPKDDPHAAYEGRLGGSLWIVSAKDGSKVAEHKMDSPVVWDGLAAAGGTLFVSTQSGQLHAWRGE